MIKTATKQKPNGTDAATALMPLVGTVEEGRATIGKKSDVYTAELEIGLPMSQIFCGHIKDANPSFWDPEFANEAWGGLIAPGGLLNTFGKAVPWRPGGGVQRRNIAMDVPLPGVTTINSSTETEFFKPLMIGERLSAYDEVVDISPEKTTRLGRGHFVTIVCNYLNSKGELVARNTNSIFRFNPHPTESKA